mmetsp:Transcript_101489/g.287568  ORF Transcript_101489/g.287568 Transcript_101489/m.287568 type:complete len:257 (+) Transcript_101489:55-825(+)
MPHCPARYISRRPDASLDILTNFNASFLRMTSNMTGKHFGTINQAVIGLNGKISKKLRNKLNKVSLAYAVVRHLTSQLTANLYSEVERELLIALDPIDKNAGTAVANHELDEHVSQDLTDPKQRDLAVMFHEQLLKEKKEKDEKEKWKAKFATVTAELRERQQRQQRQQQFDEITALVTSIGDKLPRAKGSTAESLTEKCELKMPAATMVMKDSIDADPTASSEEGGRPTFRHGCGQGGGPKTAKQKTKLVRFTPT